MNGERRFDNAVDAMRGSKWIGAVTVMLPTLIEIIDISVANVSLDHIRGSLSAGSDEAPWVLTSYLVSNAIIIPMTGWLARTFGRKRYLIFSILLFTAASFLCGASTSLGMLVFFRILQGIGGGALQPLSQAILLGTFPPSEHGMAMATVGSRALQSVLHKGQREDWFHSDFILIFSAISLLSLAAFVIVELLFAEHPIVDLRAFKNIPFTSGNVRMFIAFFQLLGGIVLLPLYAQILLGYTATLAGLMLSPGGVATLLTTPVVGKLIASQDPKHLPAPGVLGGASSTPHRG